MTDAERIEALETALLELVYWDYDSFYPSKAQWRIGIREDSGVNDFIGNLLDKYKPND